MLIALLVVLGVDLGVIVAVLVVVLARRRWVSRQPGAFRGAILVTEGDVPGLSGRWRRGYGRWVRDVLVWTKGPLLFRSELVADGGAWSAIGVASNGGKALGPFAVASGKTSVAE
jgi:hypothetical protein